MKRISAMVLAVFFILLLVGCGASESHEIKMPDATPPRLTILRSPQPLSGRWSVRPVPAALMITDCYIEGQLYVI